MRPRSLGSAGLRERRLGLGATLFEAIAGNRALEEGRERHPQLVEPHRLPPGTVPTDVAKTVYAALSPDADDRPLPHEIAGALEPVLTAQPAARLTFKVRR